jgi:hypothetical protein
MRQLSALIFVVLLVVLQSCKYFKGGLFGGKADTMVVWQARQDSIRISDSIRSVQNRLMAIETARLDSVRNADNERLSWESKYKFNIIVGSFKTPEYAKGLAEVYHNRGYNTRILKMEGSSFELVSAEAHDNFRKALTRLNAFQDTVELNAWMYIKK